ncbi:MAG TPA: HAMP domain-containing sensor histidine kinase [Solirubrobacteraceae bacterium]|nr:HAMP domain-containing sensor histidine kinase [Solirubrobacteraceae bacterium]
MSRIRPLGIRQQVAAAMVALAVLSVTVSGLLIHRAADREVESFGRRDLQQTANRLAIAASLRHHEAGGWSRPHVRALIEPERAEDHVVVLLNERGRVLYGDVDEVPPDSRRAPVFVGRERVGTVIVAHAGGGFLQVGRGRTQQRLDAKLTAELDQRLLESAIVAAGLALVLGLLVAFRVTAPLQHVTSVARRMAHGEIETRASGYGGNRETRELARVLDRLAAALRRQDELRRATGHDVAHELRGALVGVIGRLEALQDGIVQDQEAVIDRALRDARRLHKLTDDVVRFADAQRPSLLVRKRRVQLDEIASERAAAHSDRFAERGIELDCATTPAAVEGDPERLGQILENLLSNALRYTDPGGRVSVRVEVRGRHAVLRVADTGIGIPPELLARVFDRFWRAPEARDRAREGSGVGLALVRDLVVAQDGRVDVESRPGEGSTFSVFLPLAVEFPADGRSARDRDPATALDATVPAGSA